MKNAFLRLKFVQDRTLTQIFKVRIFVVILSTLFFSGCAHTPARAPKCEGVSFHSPTEVDACISESGASVGDRVAFLKPKCSAPSRGIPKKCSKVKVGSGLVTKILDEHFATIKLDSQFEVTGTMVLEIEK